MYLLAVFTQSGGDWLDGWFESDPIKAVLGFDGIVGNYASPYTPGTGYVLLHHVFGEVNGKRGAWGHAIGGMGAITQAMAQAARSKGVEIRVDSPVRNVEIEDGRAAASPHRDNIHKTVLPLRSRRGQALSPLVHGPRASSKSRAPATP
jgi:phytoene dehydrogenase-like protein